ncbi:hypothetical protein ACUNGT_06185 [Serratia sp. IR-2025]
MDNKLSELSKPVGYYRLSEDGVSYYLSSPTEKLDEEVVPLYSQEYVSALLAELEFEKQNNAGVAGMVEDYETKLAEKDKRIAELESQIEDAKASVDGGPAAWSWTGYPNRQHLTRFEPEGWKNPRDMSPLYSRQQMAGLVMMNNELRKKLATPVRLGAGALMVSAYSANSYDSEWHLCLARDSVVSAIRAAGFTVEGDE